MKKYIKNKLFKSRNSIVDIGNGFYKVVLGRKEIDIVMGALLDLTTNENNIDLVDLGKINHIIDKLRC